MKYLWIGALFFSAALSPAESVDRYGQVLSEDWPGKIVTDADFQRDLEFEDAYLRKLESVPRNGFDRYGGRIEKTRFQATGWFRLQMVRGRWWLITPEGNRFFMQGVDAVSWSESGYATPVLNPDGSTRAELTELPDPEKFPEAYRKWRGSKVNILGANLKRKYGADFETRWRETARRRLAAWGFNSTAKWGYEVEIGLPRIQDHVFHSIRRAFGRYLDMYDPNFAAQVDQEVKRHCEMYRNDRNIIAYSVENENGWNADAVKLLMRQTGKCHAKEALLNFILEREGGNWERTAARFREEGGNRQEVLAIPWDFSAISKEECSEFIRRSSVVYHRLLRETYRKYDPNHLFMGAAHCNFQAPEWYEAAAPYVDLFGFNVQYLTDYGERNAVIRRVNKPYINAEFAFVQERRGYLGYASTNTVRDEASRGIGYRLFTNEMAADSHCVGFGYFIYWDQPVTRRTLPDGESFNFGLVNYCDQPYYEMLPEVCRANEELFAVHDSAREPFRMENPREILGTAKAQKLLSRFVKGTTSPYLVNDPSKTEWFHGNSARLKLDESLPEPGIYPVGTISSDGGKRIDAFELTVYFWDSRKNIQENLRMEQSSDGVFWEEIPLKMVKSRQGTHYSEYVVSNAAPLNMTTNLIRILQNVPDPGESWSIQYCDIKLETSL